MATRFNFNNNSKFIHQKLISMLKKKDDSVSTISSQHDCSLKSWLQNSIHIPLLKGVLKYHWMFSSFSAFQRLNTQTVCTFYKELVDITLADIRGLLDVASLTRAGISAIIIQTCGRRLRTVVCGGVGTLIDIYK